MIVLASQKPPVGLMGGSVHDYERGKSPWHKDAFPDKHKHAAPEQGDRHDGWLALDWCGNVIGWYPDGTEIPDSKGAESDE